MKLLHSQSQEKVHRFRYNLHQKLTPSSHSWLFIGHFGASKPRGGGYFLIRVSWGCAAGWGRIFMTGLIRDFKIQRRGWQRERQKTIGFISKTPTLHVHHACLYFLTVFARLQRENA